MNGATTRAALYGSALLVVVLLAGLLWYLAPLRPWLDRGGLHMLEDVPAAELRLLYRHAAVTVCPSFGEGFDFSGVEAMRCGGVVAGSDIPVHHEIFGDAFESFTPYSSGVMARALMRLLVPEAQARRADLHSGTRPQRGRMTDDP